MQLVEYISIYTVDIVWHSLQYGLRLSVDVHRHGGLGLGLLIGGGDLHPVLWSKGGGGSSRVVVVKV